MAAATAALLWNDKTMTGGRSKPACLKARRNVGFWAEHLWREVAHGRIETMAQLRGYALRRTVVGLIAGAGAFHFGFVRYRKQGVP